MGSLKTLKETEENPQYQEWVAIDHNDDHDIINPNALNVEDEKKFYGTLDFDLGFLSSKIYGNGHIKGSIPLILPHGVYTSPIDPSVAEDNEKAYEYLVNWADEHGLEYRSRKYRNNVIKCSIAITASTGGTANVWSSPVIMTAVAVMLLTLIADDLQEEVQLFAHYMDFCASGPVESGVASFRQTIRDIINGKYKEFHELPSMELPMLAPFPIMAFLIYELSPKEYVENIGESRMSSLESVEDGLYAFSIAKNVKFMESCSEAMCLLIRGIDSGVIAYLDWIYTRMNYKVPDNVKVTIIFKRFVQSFSQSMALINDVLGLKKELEEENCNNMIFRKVKRRGISLEAAVNELLVQLTDELSDVQICAQKLLEDFPDSVDLKVYVERVKYSIDGHALMYMLPGCAIRYGESKFKVTYDEE